MPANKMIQFLHSGVEHTRQSGEKWNTGSHRRKFMRHTGMYLNNGNKEVGQFHFWGEWEAQSDFLPIKPELVSGKGLPVGIFSPYYSLKAKPSGAINTDPFVFGDFVYSCCRKTKNGKPTMLSKNLNAGDIILFGSCFGGNFILDTVFVVKDCKKIKLRNYEKELKGKVSNSFIETVIKPIFDENCSSGCKYPTDELTIHFGATYDDPVDDLFSFVPCASVNSKNQYFSRPIIKHPGISPRLNTNFKVMVKESQNIKMEWEEIFRQIREQNLYPAIRIDDVAER